MSDRAPFLPPESEFERIVARHEARKDNITISQEELDIDHLIFIIKAGREDMIKTLEHFRGGTDPDNPESMQHIANRNRAFGADCALSDFEQIINYDGARRVNYGE